MSDGFLTHRLRSDIMPGVRKGKTNRTGKPLVRVRFLGPEVCLPVEGGSLPVWRHGVAALRGRGDG